MGEDNVIISKGTYDFLYKKVLSWSHSSTPTAIAIWGIVGLALAIYCAYLSFYRFPIAISNGIVNLVSPSLAEEHKHKYAGRIESYEAAAEGTMSALSLFIMVCTHVIEGGIKYMLAVAIIIGMPIFLFTKYFGFVGRVV